MAFPVRDTPLVANHLAAALEASQSFRLAVMGKLTTLQQHHNGTHRLSIEEHYALLNELAFQVEVGRFSVGLASDRFDYVLRKLVRIGHGLADDPDLSAPNTDGREV